MSETQIKQIEEAKVNFFQREAETQRLFAKGLLPYSQMMQTSKDSFDLFANMVADIVLQVI